MERFSNGRLPRVCPGQGSREEKSDFFSSVVRTGNVGKQRCSGVDVLGENEMLDVDSSLSER